MNVSDAPANARGTPGRTARFEDAPCSAKPGFATQGEAEPAPNPEQALLARRLEEIRGRIVETNWQDPELLVRAAGLCLELGQKTEARGLFARALELDRNNAYARAKLAEICAPHELQELNLPAPAQSLKKDFGEPFRYPLRGSGPFMIVIGALFFGLLPALLPGPLRLLSVIIALLGLLYLAGYLRLVVCTTATDAREAPDWPDFDFGLLVNFFKMLLLGLIPLGPAIAWQVAAALLELGSAPAATVYLLLLGAGLCVFPMMLLVYCVTGHLLLALHPGQVFGGIARAGGDYWRAVAIWIAAGFGRKLLLMALAGLPLLGGLLATAVTMYFLLVAGRALGLVYQARREALGWYG